MSYQVTGTLMNKVALDSVTAFIVVRDEGFALHHAQLVVGGAVHAKTAPIEIGAVVVATIGRPIPFQQVRYMDYLLDIQVVLPDDGALAT